MTYKSKAVEVLNSLMQVNNDRIEGYEYALSKTHEADLKDYFSEFGENSRRFNDELMEEINACGGIPTEEASTSGKLHRIWLKIKSSVTKNDRKVLLNHCEYGEDWAIKTYESAPNEDAEFLTFDQTDLIRTQYEFLKIDYGVIKDLRDEIVV